MRVRFIAPANIELDEALRYYDYQLTGLGFRFFQEVDAAIERIRFMLEAGRKPPIKYDWLLFVVMIPT